MIELEALVIALGTTAAVAATIRWVRVAQREHYLAGSVIRFVWRWWARGPLDVSIATIALGGVLASAFEPATGFASAVIVTLGPFRMGLRGRSGALAWTRRLRTIVAIEAALAGVIVGIVSAMSGVGGAVTAVVACAVGVPLLVELALLCDRPIEGVVARRYVRAAQARLETVRPLVVGITGSYGKTSTKRYLEHLLSGSKVVVASPRSFNNQAGLARAVNETLTSGTQVFIAEMGTYGPGEIAAMCRWLRPSIAAITVIGPVHLERFGSLDRTLAAKREILATASTAVLNVDDERLASLLGPLEQEGKRVITCSVAERSNDVVLVVDQGSVEIIIEGRSIGRVDHDLRKPVGWENVACAIGLARAIGIDPAVLIDRLRSLHPVEHRLTVNESANGVIVLDDTYNSNPAGARLALRTLLATDRSGRLIVVTPGMVELGGIQHEENRQFAAEVTNAGAQLVVVGTTNRRALLAGAGADGAGPVAVATREEAVSWVRAHLGPGDAVLYENDLPDHYP